MLLKVQPVLLFQNYNYALVHSDDSCMNRTGVTDSSDLRSTINTHVCIYVYDIRFWSVGKVFRGQRLMAEVKLIEYLKWSNKDVFSKNKGRNIGRKLIVQTQVYRSKYNLF